MSPTSGAMKNAGLASETRAGVWYWTGENQDGRKSIGYVVSSTSTSSAGNVIDTEAREQLLARVPDSSTRSTPARRNVTLPPGAIVNLTTNLPCNDASSRSARL